MSWLFGSSGEQTGEVSGWSLFGGATVPTESRQDDRPQAKTAAKPTAMRDWELRLYNEDVDDRPSTPSWSPFMSVEESARFEKKTKKMRQMRDIGDVGDVLPLRSYEEQVLGATHTSATPRDNKQTKPSQGDQGAQPTIPEEEDDDDGFTIGQGKAIDGQEVPLGAAFWSVWPPRVTTLVASGKDAVALRPDPGSQGLALFNQDRKDLTSVEFAASLNLSRGLDSPGAAGICFQCRPKATGIRGYVFYVEYIQESDEDVGRLILGKFHAHATKNDMPETVKVISKKVAAMDGWHYFRVRNINGSLMLFYDYEFVDYVEAKTTGEEQPKKGFCGVWSHDMEVPMKSVVMRNLEDLSGKALSSMAPEEKSKVEALEELAVQNQLRIDAAILIQWIVRKKLRARHERMQPYLEFSEDEAMAKKVRQRTLAVWISAFYTMSRLQDILDEDDIKEKRMQKYLESMDKYEPPPPPPPLEPPPTPEDEELHYLYELQQLKYKKQIELSSRKVLSKAKLTTLRNMTHGSLASQQKKLVAAKQRKLAAEAASEQEHQALKQMAKRLTSNFEEMTNMVSTLRGYSRARQQDEES